MKRTSDEVSALVPLAEQKRYEVREDAVFPETLSFTKCGGSCDLFVGVCYDIPINRNLK